MVLVGHQLAVAGQAFERLALEERVVALDVVEYARLEIEDHKVTRFDEKPLEGEAWINGAFFVLEPQVFEYIEGDDTLFEREPLEGLARDGELMAYQHYGFWQCMDTIRDKVRLEALWESQDAPWKVWR